MYDTIKLKDVDLDVTYDMEDAMPFSPSSEIDNVKATYTDPNGNVCDVTELIWQFGMYPDLEEKIREINRP